MKTRLQTIIVELGVIFAMLLTVGVGAYLVPVSHDVAAANPTITYMRVPVLLIAWSILACVLAALVMAFLLLERIRKDKIFEPQSVWLLKGIGLSALVAIIPMVILIFYTQAHVTGSITNFWVVLGIFALVIVAVFFFLIASLFQRAVDYKEEVDLTV
jgi:membrane protein implicated in regulation of membrane protease activity